MTTPYAWICSGAAAVPISPVAELSVRLFPVTLTVPPGKPGAASRLPVAFKTTSPGALAVPAVDRAEERPGAQVEVHALAAGLDVQHTARRQAGA